MLGWDGMGRVGLQSARLSAVSVTNAAPDPVVACRLSGWEGQPGGSLKTQGTSLD